MTGMKIKSAHLLLLLLCAGCGQQDVTTVSVDPVWRGHLSLQPAGTPLIEYRFQNATNGFSKPTWNSDVPPEERKPLVPPHAWASTCAGILNVQWMGYQNLGEIGENQPLANFDYQLRDWSLEEGGANTENTWSSLYSPEKEISLARNGKPLQYPMGYMIGIPRKQYVDNTSRALFWPNGSALRDGGRIKKKANYRVETYSVGQYFLKGFSVEELVHRIGCPTPPSATGRPESMKGQRYEWPFASDVASAVPMEGDLPGNLIYQVVGEEDWRGRGVYKIQYRAQQKYQRAKILSTGAEVQGYEFFGTGELLMDRQSRMVCTLVAEDRAVWYDVVTLVRYNQPDRHQVVSRNIENTLRFEALNL